MVDSKKLKEIRKAVLEALQRIERLEGKLKEIENDV